MVKTNNDGKNNSCLNLQNILEKGSACTNNSFLKGSSLQGGVDRKYRWIQWEFVDTIRHRSQGSVIIDTNLQIASNDVIPKIKWELMTVEFLHTEVRQANNPSSQFMAIVQMN